MPSAPSWSASSSIRVMARSRALYIACESTSNFAAPAPAGDLDADLVLGGAS
jgi:hypothetical protein